MATMTPAALEVLAAEKSTLLKEFLEAEPPKCNGEGLLDLWAQIYDADMQKVVVKCVNGLSDDDENPVMPYEKLRAVIGSGGNWKLIRLWQSFDELERRGEAYREGEALNFELPNNNPRIIAQKVLVVGGGPVGLRLAIELVMGGHLVTVVEKRRERRNAEGDLQAKGFTNRINRPHMWPFLRSDLAKLNGRNLMSRSAAYPVFTEPETSSIGIDELQLLLLKNALLLGVDFRLGVEYADSSVSLEQDSLKPTWNVDLVYDPEAAAFFGRGMGTNSEEFDCLVGCDGPRSRVREKQQKHFGKIDKRKFMDAVGIVANLQKLSRKRLKELGFEYGQGPGDMNRDGQLFKQFFGKIREEADADIESLIYYKASFHNYVILVPRRGDMVKNGLSSKVMAFHQTRDGKGAPGEEKEKLKNYCRRVLKAAGIPVDDEASNGGFVDAPNDCMAFDFAECWNTKKALHFNLPPPGYSVDVDGEWEGRELVPFVGLAGDALLEPFWPGGLGLKRGWHAIMDTAYAIDNLYNSSAFLDKLGLSIENMSWEDHFDALAQQCADNFQYCSRCQFSEELSAGEYAENGIVMNQLKRRMVDPEKPSLLVEIDPWTRYAPLAAEVAAKQRNMPREQKNAWLHPEVQKYFAMRKYYTEIASHKDKEMISVNGRVVVEVVKKAVES